MFKLAGKTLILVDAENDWLSRGMAATGLADVAQVYKEISYLEKRLRTLHYHTKLAKTCWYGAWKDTVERYDTVILFDVFLDSDVAEYIEQKAPQARLIVFYRNPWYNNYYVSKEARKKCEIWSFDKEDCKKYGLRHNHQFYLREAVKQTVDDAYASDVFFVGKDKGRISLLEKIQGEVTHMGLKPVFYIVPERHGQYTPAQQKLLHQEHLSYLEVLKYNKNTHCLLELMQENQQGFTLRTVEAMFFNKKLVTNNAYLKSCAFYDPRNIFILGQDQRTLATFLKEEPPAAWAQEVVAAYSFEHWLQNFDK